MTVEVQDVQKAIEYANQIWNWFEQVVEIMDVPPQIRKERLHKRARERILDILREKNTVTNRELLDEVQKQVPISNSYVYRIRKELETQELICTPSRGLYKMKGECEKCKLQDSCEYEHHSDEILRV